MVREGAGTLRDSIPLGALGSLGTLRTIRFTPVVNSVEPFEPFPHAIRVYVCTIL